jgi:hypothetical protein
MDVYRMGCLFGMGGEEIEPQYFIDSAMRNSMAIFSWMLYNA